MTIASSHTIIATPSDALLHRGHIYGDLLGSFWTALHAFPQSVFLVVGL